MLSRGAEAATLEELLDERKSDGVIISLSLAGLPSHDHARRHPRKTSRSRRKRRQQDAAEAEAEAEEEEKRGILRLSATLQSLFRRGRRIGERTKRKIRLPADRGPWAILVI